jgi:Glycosyltransferase family 87
MIGLHLFMLWQERWAIPIGFPDFSIFYTAGTILRTGHGSQLYNQALQESVQGSFAAGGIANRGSILPYFHPPFEAVFFVPFTLTSYFGAYLIFAAVNLALIVALSLMLRRELPALGSLPAWLWPLAALGFTPIFIALMQGQDSIFLLFCYVMAYSALRRGADTKVGAWLALGLCKYHLVLPFMAAFVVQRQKKVLAGFFAVLLLLGVIAFAAVGWAGLQSYPQFAWSSEHSMRYLWNNFHGNTTNLRGLLLGLLPLALQQNGSKPTFGLIVAASLVTLVVADYVWLKAPATGPGRDLAFALNLVATLLVSYHAFVQDMSILFLAILLVMNVLLSDWPVEKWARRLLIGSAGVLSCAPVYMVLILVYGKLSLIVWIILIFFTGLLGAITTRSTDPVPVIA